ncbi:MAG: putative dienelactone hydrolase [Pseudohongiellaceae bacterium]|jgi:predicted dienelactone hydrolase
MVYSLLRSILGQRDLRFSCISLDSFLSYEYLTTWKAYFMAKKVLKSIFGLTFSLAILAVAIFVATNPERPQTDSASAQWLEPGPYSVSTSEFVFIDKSRSTDSNRGFAGEPDRTFPTTVWYPQGATGKIPLLIHSHGIVSARNELSYLMEQLASYGYVVAAADYPLTSGSAPGGANANDVMNQPADVSFLIDSILGLADEQPFAEQVDESRIGLSGFSLGGLTTILATYHPRWRDPRIAASAAIAGPAVAFTDEFYTTSDVPFLMISGTSDALIDTQYNAAIIPNRNDNSDLVIISGGSHLGFVGAAEPSFRLMHNPDSLGCSAVLSVLDEDPNEVFAELGSLGEGVYMPPDTPGVCELMPLREALHPGRQQMITTVAVLSFFESIFSEDQARREEGAVLLRESLALDFEEVSVRSSY